MFSVEVQQMLLEAEKKTPKIRIVRKNIKKQTDSPSKPQEEPTSEVEPQKLSIEELRTQVSTVLSRLNSIYKKDAEKAKKRQETKNQYDVYSKGFNVIDNIVSGKSNHEKFGHAAANELVTDNPDLYVYQESPEAVDLIGGFDGYLATTTGRHFPIDFKMSLNKVKNPFPCGDIPELFCKSKKGKKIYLITKPSEDFAKIDSFVKLNDKVD